MSTSERIDVIHVDDEPDFAEMAATFLERADERLVVGTATGADEGIARLAEGDIDCIVSDYDMPGRDGIEFLETVREEYPDLPFILYTGKGSEEIAGDAISAGVTDYLQKGSGTSQYTVLANRITNAVDQYRSERTLSENREQLSLFFEQSPLGVIEWDEDFRFARVNETAQEILGRTESELIGKSWEAIVPGSDREAAKAIVDELRNADGNHGSINENVTGDGKRIVCEWHNRAITGEDGSVDAIFSMFRDVTEEYRRRERQERQHDALVELATNDAVAGGDFRSALREITETAAEILDVDRVNVWLLDQSDDGDGDDDSDGDDVFRCVDHYDRRSNRHDDGMELPIEEYPRYCEALKSEWTITADDARADPRTAELTDGYLDVHGIGAILDAVLHSEGEVVGVVCHEHVGGPRSWTDDEIQFASDVSDIVHRALRNHEQVERQQERKFRESLLKAQQEATIDGVLVGDDDGEIVTYNDRFLELWGVSEELIERGTDEEAFSAALELVANPDEFCERIEYLLAHPDETSRDEIELTDGRVLDRYSAPVTDDDGTYYGRLWTFREATDRNHREHVLKQLHDATRTILRAETKQEAAELIGEAAVNVLGYSNNIVRLLSEDGSRLEPVSVVSEHLPADLDERPVYEVGEETAGLAFERGEPIVYEDVSELDDGKERGGVQAGAYLPIGDQGVLTITEFEPGVFDETDVQLASILTTNAAIALDRIDHRREQQARVETLTELNAGTARLFRANTPEAICEIVAETARDVLGYPSTTVRLLDEDRDVLVPVTVSERAREELGERPEYPVGEGTAGQAFAAQEPIIVEDAQKIDDGYPRGDAGGVVYLPIGEYGTISISDTAPRKFDESDIELARLLTASAEAALYRVKQQETVERQNERLDRFTSVISHDLRNPLNVAQGRLRLFETDRDDEHLKSVETALDRMESLIDDLLTLAQEGEAVIEREPIDLSAITNGCWTNVETAAATLVVDADLSVPGDESRLKQVFENLFGNAVEHGGEDVTVRIGQLDDGFYVEDDGSGIPEANRDELFEAGYSTSETGTGFGLSIVEKIVEAHGWEIGVTEGSDGGARFEITGVDFEENGGE